jgi:hypothetical protein
MFFYISRQYTNRYIEFDESTNNIHLDNANISYLENMLDQLRAETE